MRRKPPQLLTALPFIVGGLVLLGLMAQDSKAVRGLMILGGLVAIAGVVIYLLFRGIGAAARHRRAKPPPPPETFPVALAGRQAVMPVLELPDAYENLPDYCYAAIGMTREQVRENRPAFARR